MIGMGIIVEDDMVVPVLWGDSEDWGRVGDGYGDDDGDDDRGDSSRRAVLHPSPFLPNLSLVLRLPVSYLIFQKL